jgi:DNA-binding response OmpR family regulator
MAIKAILLDREREIFPLLGDIFNVTGHKLLIAASDEMFRELMRSATVDIVIINQADIKSWIEVCREGCTPLPFFIVEREEEERRLKALGFSELNYIRKPFNPLELLNKLSYLHKLDPLREAHSLGFLSTVIKLSNLGETRIVELSGNLTCEVGIKEGRVIGITSGLEDLRTLLEEGGTSLKVKDFEDLTWEQTFEDTRDFIRTMIERARPLEITAPTPDRLPGEFRQVEEVEEGVYRISKFSSVPVILKNVYLRIYEDAGRRVAFLINAGSLDEWSGVRNLVEDVLLSLGELDAVVVLGGDLSSLYNVFILGDQHRGSLQVIADYSVKRFLSESGFRSGKIRTFEDFPSYSVTVTTGHRIRFIPLNFSPYPGGFCLYEEDTGFLFTPDFLSSLFSEDPKDPLEGVRLFHRIYMPSGEVLRNLISRVSGLRIRKVFPRYGLPYGNADEVIEALKDLKTGVDLSPVSDLETVLALIKGTLTKVMNLEDRSVADKFVEELSRFATVEGGTVSDIYVEPRFALELLVRSLLSVPGIKPSTVLAVLKELTESEVFIHPL